VSIAVVRIVVWFYSSAQLGLKKKRKKKNFEVVWVVALHAPENAQRQQMLSAADRQTRLIPFNKINGLDAS